MAKPLISAVVAILLLVSAAVPYFDTKKGTASIETLPGGDAKAGFQVLQRDFYAGLISPVEIVIDGPADDPRVTAAVGKLTTTMETDGAFGPATVTYDPNRDLTVLSVPLKQDPNDQSSYETVDRLRDSLIPAAFADAPAEVYVGGETALSRDFNDTIDTWTPRVFAFVLGLSFLLLLLAFRSIVVPMTAIVMNLLSVGAAYGLLVLVFQKGYGADVFGFTQTPAIESFLPIFLFCILFGLSMDYHVFLLSRIREHYDQTHNNRESVASGLQSTAKIITGAALIMVAVFAGFASGRLVTMQQIGFGLAVAVLLDATVVRSILVPSLMTLLGDRNWYMPRWLSWLPNLSIEGAPVAHVAPATVANERFAPEATAAD